MSASYSRAIRYDHKADHIVPPRSYEGRLFLYLGKAEWAATWVEGGDAPLSPASKYLGDRIGTSTPDEMRQRIVDGADNDEVLNFFAPGFKNMTITGGGSFFMDHPDGTYTETIADNIVISNYLEDALILCLACSASRSIMEKLGKVACVEILDISALRAGLDRQIGLASTAGRVSYTAGTDRAHFLKSVEDEWQDEYRLSWRQSPAFERIITVPPGTASRVF